MGVAGFWGRVLVDHVGSVIAEHGSRLGGDRRRSRGMRPDRHAERRRRGVGYMLYNVLRDPRLAVRALAKSPTFTS